MKSLVAIITIGATGILACRVEPEPFPGAKVMLHAKLRAPETCYPELTAEQQLDFHLYTRNAVEPPMYDMTCILKLEPSVLVPLVIDRLSREDDGNIWHLMVLIEELTALHPSTVQDTELEAAVRASLARMKDATFRSSVSRMSFKIWGQGE